MKHAARRRTRTLAAAGALVLLGSLTACGDDGGAESAPEGASKEDFCEAVGEVFGGAMEAESDTDAQIEALKSSVEKLADVGTPDSIPDDARNGFEILVRLTSEVEEGMSEDELDSLGDDLSAEDEKDFEAFIGYSAETCPEALGGGLDAPEMPEDLESELGDPESEAPVE